MSMLCLGLAAWSTIAADDGASPDTQIWRTVRAALFGQRPIADTSSDASIVLEIPARAADAAVVPVAIRIKQAANEPTTKKLYLVIDRNPSPIAAIFEFGPRSAGADVETRIRIEQYTWVRVIAERADGSLVATQRYVKAAGGCSAPAGKSLAERLAGTGQMKWRIDPADDGPSRHMVQLMIRHPNNSGLAMDQVTHLYDPPYFVRNVQVTQGGEMVFSAQVDFSISENPAFRFSILPGSAGALQARVVDSNERSFESTALVNP